MNQRKDDFAFILNLFFLHQNSSHNKEKIINTKIDSPIIFLDEFFNSSFIIIDNNYFEGEAGYFTEKFIGNRDVILGLSNCSNKLGSLLDINLFNKENFNELIESYNYITSFDNENKELTSYQPLIDNKNKNKEVSQYSNPIYSKRDNSDFNEFDKYLFRQAKATHCDY